MKYLVTGADGFLGKYFLAEFARRNIPVRAMLIEDTPELPLPGNPEIVRGNLLRKETLGIAVDGVTHLIHLAARVHIMDDPEPDLERAFFEVNVEGTRSLLEAAGRAKVSRFLLMSTVKAMGEEQTGAFDESTAPHPTSPYGRSKLAAERAMLEMAEAKGIHAVVLRLPMVYGPGAKGNVLRLLEAGDRNRRLPFGSVENRRSMVYVENVIDAALLAIESAKSAGEVYLVCDERPYSTREVYTEICIAMGKEPLLRHVPVCALKLLGVCGDMVQFITHRPMPVNSGVIRRVTRDLYFSSEKIRCELGFTPKLGLAEGIRRTVKWYQQGCPPVP